MSDLPDELPPGAFLASMPWWVVLGRDDGSPGGGQDAGPGFLVLDADGSTCLAVFTDEDLAQRFVDAAEFDGGPLPVETPQQFASLARRLPAFCEYAAFDPPPHVGARARWVVPLAGVLEALREAEDDVDGDAEPHAG
jgi:hypothetical protein